jgi:hypothetical protein
MEFDYLMRRTFERRFAGEQAISNDAKTVDVGARIKLRFSSCAGSDLISVADSSLVICGTIGVAGVFDSM